MTATEANGAGRRDLRLLALAVGLSAAGDMLAIITLALLVHDLTGSAFAVSALFAATMLPVVLMAPLAGRIADRFESGRVLLVASAAQLAVALALAFAGSLTEIVALAALLTAGAAVAGPAEFALVPAAAPPGQLAAATGRMEAARYAGHTAGPLLATALVAAAIAREDPKAPPDLRPRLERTEKVRRDQTSEIQRLEDQVARLRADLRTATRRARERRRTSERLRRKLRAARRSPAREASR